MNLDEALKSRRSVRRFKADKPPRELIERLVGSAVLAPSASNKQPWRFFIVDDKALIGRMADAVQRSVDRVASHVEPSYADAFRAYGDYFVRFREAPVVVAPVFKELVVLSQLVDGGLEPEDAERVRVMEADSGLISVSLALQNLMLSAHALGLGTSCMTGPLMAADELAVLLGVPAPWRIAALVPVGYADEAPAPVSRKPAESVIRWVDPKAAAPSDQKEESR